MSKGTDKLKEVMDQHQANALACQASNTAKADADVAFAKTAQDVKDAVAAVEQEATDLSLQSVSQFGKAESAS